MTETTNTPVNEINGHKSIAIDILRSIAALGVFYYHTHIGELMAHYSSIGLLGYTDSFGATYAVPLFFLLSGYCIHASNIKYIKAGSRLPLKAYYIRRIIRIYPPYFIALLFSIIVNYITIPAYKLSLTDFSIHLCSLQGFSANYFNTINVVFWTISVELAFYAIYPAFYYLRLKYNLTYSLALVFGVSCVSIAFLTFKNSVITPVQFFGVFNLWFAWCCGAFLADKKILNPNDLKRPIYIYIYSGILVAFAYSTFYLNDFSIISYQFKILIWLAPLAFILSQEKRLKQLQDRRIIKLGVILGISSYSLYLLHEPLLQIKNWAIHRYLPVKLQTIFGIIGILIIPFITFLNYCFIEKPFLNLRSSKKVKTLLK